MATNVREQEQRRREAAAEAGAAEVAGRTPWQLFWLRFRRDRVALAALGFIVFLILVAALAGPTTGAVAHPPDAQFPRALDPNFGTPTGPSSTFLFGVDKVGEDVFSRVCTPGTPREKGSVEAAVRHLKSGFWPARRFRDLPELEAQYVDWRDERCNARIHASGRFPAAERLAEERAALRPLPPARFDWSGHRSVRVPIDGYLKHGRCFYRAPERLVHERVELRFDGDQVWILHRGSEVARYERSYEQGIWLPPPIMRPEPPPAAAPALIRGVAIAPPELREDAELCA
jgi:hypothetical protein